VGPLLELVEEASTEGNVLGSYGGSRDMLAWFAVKNLLHKLHGVDLWADLVKIALSKCPET